MGFEFVDLSYILAALTGLGTFVFLLKQRRNSKNKSSDPSLGAPQVADFQRGEIEGNQIKFISLEEALQNTQRSFWGRLKGVFAESSSFDKAQIDQLEEILYTSDLGPKTVQKLMGRIENQLDSSLGVDGLHSLLKSEMKDIFSSNNAEILGLNNQSNIKKPVVWMVIGVNGAGKTTTIGKLCHKLASQNKKVMVAAGDTFRAAAKEQLKTWAERSQVVFFSPEGIDNPSGVAFDAVKEALHQEVDILIVDTAGRLHTQGHLMEELKKIKRVLDKAMPGAPHETLLVLDANSGQNALIQAQQFHDAVGVTGVILTKMDGTAKGGVVLGVVEDVRLNIKMIGVGEKVEDLRAFDSQSFVNSIL